MKLTNVKNINLSMAVFLASDNYDHDSRSNCISATTLLKSVRQIILSQRTIFSDTAMDISALAASSFGTAIHDAVEKSWSNGNHIKALRRLGYTEETIERFKVNPKPEEISADTIPIYIEIRSEKPVGKFIVSGKFDFVGDGELEDHKTTGVYTYIKNTNSEKYKLQGSIYKWLNPEIITSSRMSINFVFTDWSALKATIEKNKGYPHSKIMHVHINLMSIEETQKYVEAKIKAIEAYFNTNEADLPLCTKEDLWQDATVFKYYKNPSNNRPTKNFNSFAEAQSRLIQDGSIGIINIVPAQAKACKWCAGFNSCSQAKQLIADGTLIMEE